MCKLLVTDLASGFEDFADVECFLKANIVELLTVGSEAKNAKLTSIIGTPPILKFLVSCKPAEDIFLSDEEVPLINDNERVEIRSHKDDSEPGVLISDDEEERHLLPQKITDDDEESCPLISPEEFLQQKYAQTMQRNKDKLANVVLAPHSNAYKCVNLASRDLTGRE